MSIDPTAEPGELLERLRQDLQLLATANQDLAARLDAELLGSKTRLHLTGALAIGIALMVLTSQATRGRGSQVVETEKLVLTDETGHKRASMFVSMNDRAVLLFYGENDKVALELTAGTDGFAGLRTFDGEENNRVLVGSDTRGEAGLAVFDRSERLIVKIPTLFPGGGALLKLPPPGLPGAGETGHF